MTKKFLAILICFQAFVSFAQDPVTSNELDAKYTPNKASLFYNGKKRFESSSYGIPVSNIIQVYPTMLLRQKAFVTFEKGVLPNLYLSAGIGKSFGVDPFMKSSLIISSGSEFSSYFSSSVSEGYLMNNSKFYDSGVLLYGGIKLYPAEVNGNESPGNVFIEFGFRHERIDLLLSPKNSYSKVSGDNIVRFYLNQATLGIGYTFASGKNPAFIQTIFIKPSYTYFQYTDFTQTTDLYGKTTLTSDPLAPLKSSTHWGFSIGYSLGFGFD